MFKFKEDQILEEVRQSGREMEKEANGDLHQFFENLRQAEKKHRERLVRFTRPSQASTKDR